MVEKSAQKVYVKYMIEQLGGQFHGHIPFKKTHEPQTNAWETKQEK